MWSKIVMPDDGSLPFTDILKNDDPVVVYFNSLLGNGHTLTFSEEKKKINTKEESVTLQSMFHIKWFLEFWKGV